MLKILQDNGIPVGKFYAPVYVDDIKEAAARLGYPKKDFIIKPRCGSGSKGLKIVTSHFDTYDSFIQNKQISTTLDKLADLFSSYPEKISEFVIMEYLPGNKYSADILSEHGEVKSMVIRNNGKDLKINPPTQLADIVFDGDIREYSKRICELLKFDFFIQIESGRGKDGKPYYIETNPRLDATTPITTGLGVNFYHEMINYAINGSFSINIDIVENNRDKTIRFFRFWDHTFKEV